MSNIYSCEGSPVSRLTNLADSLINMAYGIIIERLMINQPMKCLFDTSKSQSKVIGNDIASSGRYFTLQSIRLVDSKEAKPGVGMTSNAEPML